MKKNLGYLLLYIWMVLVPARVFAASEADPSSTDAAAGISPEKETQLLYCYYGTKKICVKAPSDSLGIMQIGGDAYPVSIGSSGELKIKLSRIYPLNEEVVLFLKYQNLVFKVRSKLRSDTFAGTVCKDKNILRFKMYNLHKGDIVYVKHRGITYKKTIKKNYDSIWKTVTFTARRKIRSNGERVIVIIKNKARKKLDYRIFKLKKGYAAAPGVELG